MNSLHIYYMLIWMRIRIEHFDIQQLRVFEFNQTTILKECDTKKMSDVNEEKVISLVKQLKESRHWTNMNDNRWQQVATEIGLGGIILTGEQCKKIYGKRNKKNSKKKAKKQRAVPPAETGLTEGTMDADVASSQLLLTVEQISFPPASNGMWPTGDKVKALLKVKGIDVNVRDKNGRTPLYQACLNRDTWIARLLLAVPNIDVNLSCPSDGTTPLHVACKSDSGIVEQLLRNEHIQVNLLATKGLTALYVACEYGVDSNAKHLVKAVGIDVNKTQSANGWTPLMVACNRGHVNAQGHLSCIETLLGAPGIDVNKARNDGATALYVACRRQHLEAVNLLLRAQGIDINKAKKNGETPLFMACLKKNWDIVVLLLKNDSIQMDEAAWKIIINVMVYPVTRQDEISKIIENKLDVDINNLKLLLAHGEYNSSFFYKACNQNLPKIVTVLSARDDCDVNQRFVNATGTTPLTEAIPSLELVRILLKCKGIDVNKQDGIGYTPLIQACLANSVDVLLELLQNKGVRINSKSADGSTALHYACGDNRVSSEIISILLERPEIKVNELTNGSGQTPLIQAIASGRLDKVKLLMERRDIDMSKTRGDSTGNLETPLFWAFEHFDDNIPNYHFFDVLKFMLGKTQQYPRFLSDLPYLLSKSIPEYLRHGHFEHGSNYGIIVKSVLHYPIDLNYYWNQETPLTTVCRNVHDDDFLKYGTELVALLLSNPNVDINKKTLGDPESALHIACRRGLLPIVEMLVARQDVKVNDSNVWGATALFLACNEDISPASLGMVQSLLTRTDIRINESVKMTPANDVKSSWTPLHEACSDPRKVELVKLLLSDSRIDVDKKTSTGNTALHMAVKSGSEKTVRILIGYFKNNNSEKKKVRINQQNNEFDNAVDLAITKHFTNIGVLLVENGGMQSLPQAMQQQLKKRASTRNEIGEQIRKKIQRPVDGDGRIANKIVDMMGLKSRKRSTLIF